MAADAGTQIDPIITASTYAKNILFEWGGTNDVTQGQRTSAQIYGDIKAYCQARKTAGVPVVVAMALMPRNVPSQETTRAAINASLRADFNVATANPRIFKPAGGITYADFFIDIGADPDLGLPDSELNTTFFVDTVHLTSAGLAIVAAYAKATIDLVP